MTYLGWRAVNSTVYVMVTTSAAAGSPIAPSSAFETADFLLYKDGSANQRTSQSGWSISSPFDSIVGLHQLTIDLSDNTDAGFYAAGSHYKLVLSPDETVDGLAVVRVVAEWDIGVPAANVTQWLGTAPSTPTVAGVPNVNAKTWNDLPTVELPLVPTTAGRKLDVSAGGEAGVDWANVGSPTTVQNLSGTTIKTATDIATAIAALVIPTTAQITAATLAMAYEGAETFQDHLRIARAALYGLASGLNLNLPKYRDLANTKDRISATTDASGNRTVVTTDAT